MKMKTMLVTLTMMLALAITPVVSMADPAPFGLALGKMKVEEFIKEYKARKVDTSAWVKGPIFEIDAAGSGIQFDGISNLTAIFDDDGVLQHVSFELPNEKFDDINRTLEKKYKPIRGRHPFGVADDWHKLYRAGSTTIEVSGRPSIEFNSPYSTNMYVNYSTDLFIYALTGRTNLQPEIKRRSGKSQL